MPERPSRGWRILAFAFLFLGGLPTLPGLLAGRPSALLIVLPGWIGIAGLFAYGFGWRARPLWFWRAFAIPFSFLTMASAGKSLGALFGAIAQNPDAVRLSSVAAVLTAVPLMFLACVAILRFARLLGRSSAGSQKAYEQIFA